MTICIGLTECSNHPGGKAPIDKILSDSTLTHYKNSATTDSLPLQKDKLIKIYAKGIAAFIKASYKKDKTTFDTLYFGKRSYGQPDDFPDMELPETIEKTHIRLITPEMAQKMRAERKSFVYVNMMGWVDNKQAEFALVMFANGAEHLYDYFINFNYNTSTDNYDLDRIEFENYLQSKGEKPKRIPIFIDGDYVGD